MAKPSLSRSFHSQPRFFPPPETAGEDGLVGIGGELSPEWLLDAYRHGIFPWPLAGGLLAWWSPDPRAILDLNGLRVSRRLARTCRSGRYQVTTDRDFCRVIEGCATAQERRHGTWITPELRDAYCKLHAMGVTHSVEVWHDDRLAGGVYGIALGGLFAAESMFYYQRDASKVALVALVERLRTAGYALLDIQQLTPHTERMGAIEISRGEFLVRLHEALQRKVAPWRGDG
jgi:leucyl/phenylalanyl-tRNA---protein transferase